MAGPAPSVPTIAHSSVERRRSSSHHRRCRADQSDIGADFATRIRLEGGRDDARSHFCPQEGGFFAQARAELDDQGDFSNLFRDFFALEAAALGEEVPFCGLEPAKRDDQGDFFTLIGDFCILIGDFCALEAPDCVTKRAERDAEVALQGAEPALVITF